MVIYDEVTKSFSQKQYARLAKLIEKRKQETFVSTQELPNGTLDTYQSKSGWITETMTFNGSGNTYSNIYKQGKEVGNG